MNKQDILDAIAYIGVDPNDFNLKNSYFKCPIVGSQRAKYHGIGHIYRVMIGTALLAKELEEPRLGMYAFCGAFLHDLARVNDGGDFGHGLRAANESFEQFNHIWNKYKFSKYEKDLIRAACANHTSHPGHNFNGTWLVNQLVHEADALDRCRFHGRARLNPKYLALKESKKLIKVLEGLCAPTERWVADISLVGFIDKATYGSNLNTAAASYCREYAPDVISAPIADHQVFVFNQKQNGGSRFPSAQTAVKYFGAANWVGEGLTGQAYAIPCDYSDLKEIAKHVDSFILFAKANPNLEFLVTKIACGKGTKWSVSDIAPLFKFALPVENILLPKEFVDEIEK